MRNEEQIARLKLMIEHVRAMSERLLRICERLERQVTILERVPERTSDDTSMSAHS